MYGVTPHRKFPRVAQKMHCRQTFLCLCGASGSLTPSNILQFLLLLGTRKGPLHTSARSLFFFPSSTGRARRCAQSTKVVSLVRAVTRAHVGTGEAHRCPLSLSPSLSVLPLCSHIPRLFKGGRRAHNFRLCKCFVMSTDRSQAHHRVLRRFTEFVVHVDTITPKTPKAMVLLLTAFSRNSRESPDPDHQGSQIAVCKFSLTGL